MAKRRPQIGDYEFSEDPTGGSLASDAADRLAHVEGQLAMAEIMVQQNRGKPYWKQLMRLKRAAQRDPVAAYNLGNYLNDGELPGHERPRRRSLIMRFYEQAATLGLDRIVNAKTPWSKAPARERDLRTIISYSLTNIGGAIANGGRPKDAVSYFEQAIHLCDANANAHVSLGNMGVWHSEESGQDLMAGIACWEKAAALGDFCHESEVGCPCRLHTIAIARQVEKDYGAAEARAWLARHAVSGRRKGSRAYGKIAKLPADVGRLTGRPLKSSVASAANQIAAGFRQMKDMPLEMRVTVAGSLLASLCRLDAPHGRGKPQLIEQAIESLVGVEPLRPFIGDDEWNDMGPPETLYLNDSDMRGAILAATVDTVNLLRVNHSGLTAADAVQAMLFNLDDGFRRGVGSMAAPAIEEARQPIVYVAGIVIGNPKYH